MHIRVHFQELAMFTAKRNAFSAKHYLATYSSKIKFLRKWVELFKTFVIVQA
jgi:hypothetical protein